MEVIIRPTPTATATAAADFQAFILRELKPHTV
jgi:hypothetical protein